MVHTQLLNDDDNDDDDNNDVDYDQSNTGNADPPLYGVIPENFPKLKLGKPTKIEAMSEARKDIIVLC